MRFWAKSYFDVMDFFQEIESCRAQDTIDRHLFLKVSAINRIKMQENSFSRPCLPAPNPHKWGLQPGQVLSLGLWSPKTKINLQIPLGKSPRERGYGGNSCALRVIHVSHLLK